MQILIIILVILLGFALILADLLFIPGGVVAVTGSLFIVGALITAWRMLGSTTALWLAFGSLVLAGLIAFLSIKFKVWRVFVANGDESKSAGFDAHDPGLESLIGLTGEASSDLRPGGIVLIQGKKHDAVAEDGFITAGSHVVVIGVTTGQVKVKKSNLI